VAEEAGRKASVVEATELETIESLAYGEVVAPIPTASVVVAKVTFPMLSVVHPPPVDAPETVMFPQETSPEPFV